jgi:hypothetical protein
LSTPRGQPNSNSFPGGSELAAATQNQGGILDAARALGRGGISRSFAIARQGQERALSRDDGAAFGAGGCGHFGHRSAAARARIFGANPFRAPGIGPSPRALTAEPSAMNGPNRPLRATVFKRLSRFRVAPFFRADVGVYIGIVVNRGGDLTKVGTRLHTEGR